MIIPKTLKCGAHDYAIEMTKAKDPTRSRANWGKTLIEDKRILIDQDMPTSQIEETFIHEILHLCCFGAGLSYDFDDKVVLTEEQVVARLAPWLHQILKDNHMLKEPESPASEAKPL